MAGRTRNSSTGSQFDINSIESNTYSEKSGSRKIIPAGWILNSVVASASAAAGTNIQYGTNMAFYNNSSTVAWVSFYLQGTSVPTPGPTNAQAVPPNSYAYLNSGKLNAFVVSAATCISYVMDDETKYQPISNQ
jgi:hypothetical protein